MSEALDVSKLSDKAAAEALELLAARFDVSLNPRKPAADMAKAIADGFADENADGTIVLRLRKPVELNGELVTRATMRRVKVKDMRGAEVGLKTDLIQLTARLVDPAVFDELESDDDATTFLAAGARQLGKYKGSTPSTSDASSASSAGTSGSPRLI